MLIPAVRADESEIVLSLRALGEGPEGGKCATRTTLAIFPSGEKYNRYHLSRTRSNLLHKRDQPQKN